ncbi:ubiquitin-specific protease ubp1, partial [Linderina pennispora]
SLASLREFELYLDNCLEFLAEDGVVRSNSVDKAICAQLKLVMDELAPQQRRVKALSPRMLISSLSQKGRWVSSMGEQDAQELFQMISSTLQSSRRESDASIFNSGFLTKNSVISIPSSDGKSEGPRTATPGSQVETSYSGSTATCRMPPFSNPLLGMAASRIACVKCGYTAAIRHFTFDNLSLAVPRASTTTIEACLGMYTVIDRLDDFKCRHCTLTATLHKIKQDIAHHQAELANTESESKRAKRHIAAISRLSDQQDEVTKALATNPETNLKGIELVSPPPGVSTKQTMIARTPKILVLHLSRSIFTPSGDMIKNPARVRLQLLLDISPFTTTGHINTNASAPISGPQPLSAASKAEAKRNNCLYRLSAVVVHAGSHHSGHFYAYRRVAGEDERMEAPGKWFCISDHTVAAVSLDHVLASGDAYMLFYERL